MLIQLPDGNYVDPSVITMIRIFPRQDNGVGGVIPDRVVFWRRGPDPYSHSIHFDTYEDAANFCRRLAAQTAGPFQEVHNV